MIPKDAAKKLSGLLVEIGEKVGSSKGGAVTEERTRLLEEVMDIANIASSEVLMFIMATITKQQLFQTFEKLDRAILAVQIYDRER